MNWESCRVHDGGGPADEDYMTYVVHITIFYILNYFSPNFTSKCPCTVTLSQVMRRDPSELNVWSVPDEFGLQSSEDIVRKRQLKKYVRTKKSGRFEDEAEERSLSAFLLSYLFCWLGAYYVCPIIHVVELAYYFCSIIHGVESADPSFR